MTDPVELLRELYPKLDNGQKQAAKEAGESILEMRTRIADLESTLERGPQPEALASLSARVVDPTTQIEWLVTVRDGGPARLCLLISAMPIINESLAGQGLIALDAYMDGRRAERQENKALAAPAVVTPPKQVTAIQGSSLTFQAETLEKSTKGEKTYYKVKGDKFTKFGVTIWPEVLAAAGFDLDTLTGVTDLAGYTAHYILNDKGDPGKVIGLEQPA